MRAYGRSGSGDAGNETSRARRIVADKTGLTGKRQRVIFELVAHAGRRGVTVGEVEDYTGLGHGPASSALTHLHRAGHIQRITEQRRKQEVYVHPEFRDDRTESPYRPRREIHHPRYLTKEQVLAAMMDAQVDESFYPEVKRVIENLP
jgi:ribosomal protein S25